MTSYTYTYTWGVAGLRVRGGEATGLRTGLGPLLALVPPCIVKEVGMGHNGVSFSLASNRLHLLPPPCRNRQCQLPFTRVLFTLRVAQYAVLASIAVDKVALMCIELLGPQLQLCPGLTLKDELLHLLFDMRGQGTRCGCWGHTQGKHHADGAFHSQGFNQRLGQHTAIGCGVKPLKKFVRVDCVDALGAGECDMGDCICAEGCNLRDEKLYLECVTADIVHLL
mmetsp:Transcript_3172/g.6839  ORF Transcript_3172/g.6839 Transcript_3172/m.6839 type:complete len:224 (-) Transcript_3172:350-1021(-)